MFLARPKMVVAKDFFEYGEFVLVRSGHEKAETFGFDEYEYNNGYVTSQILTSCSTPLKTYSCDTHIKYQKDHNPSPIGNPTHS